MAAPTLQAQGAVAASATASITVTLPTHAADDILVLALAVWVVNTAGDAAQIPTPSGWTLIGTQIGQPGGTRDGWLAWFWKRATSGSETNPVCARGGGWDTGTDTCFAGRAYTIRGCIATGDPWDDAQNAGPYTTTTGAFAALTVSGTERMAVHFYNSMDNNASGAAPTGWTAGTEALTSTGTDAGFQTFRKDNISSNTAADEANVAAPAQGAYGFKGLSFKPPAAPANPTISSASMADADRDWDVPFQDIAITFSEAVDITPAPSVGDTIAGLTVRVNGGVSAALTYRSGNGTASWKARRAELIQQNDTVVMDYVQASGDILAVDDNAELSGTVGAAVTNNLTKRARFILKKSDNTVVASESVKYGLFQYDSGVPLNTNWMTRDTKGIVVTTAAGLVDVQYTGGIAVGGTIYVVIIRPDTTPTESMVWSDTVQ